MFTLTELHQYKQAKDDRAALEVIIAAATRECGDRGWRRVPAATPYDPDEWEPDWPWDEEPDWLRDAPERDDEEVYDGR